MYLLLFVLVSGVVLSSATLAVFVRPRWVVDHPRSVLAVVALVTLIAAGAVFKPSWPFFRIELDPSSEPLLPVSDPGQDVYRQAVLDFGSDDIFVIAMETDDVFTAENLEVVRRVTDEVRRLDGVSTVESLLEVNAFNFDEQEQWVEITKFIKDVPQSPEALAALRARALADPLYPDVIVSSDGRTAAINVTFRPMTDGEFVELDLNGAILRILERETGDGRHFFVSGRPHIRAEAHHLMVWDLITLIPMAVVIANVILFLITGSLRATLIPLGSCLVGTLWSYAALSLMGGNLNVITIVLGPILICVGTVYGIHVFARYEQITLRADSPYDAALETLEYTRLPVVMAGFTTCVGFGALTLADVRATNQLGGYCLFGIAAITVLSLTLVPAVLSLLPLERGTGDGTTELWTQRTRLSALAGRGIDVWLRAVGQLNVRFPTAILGCWAGITLAAVLLIPNILIDTDFLNVFDPRHHVRTDFANVNRVLAGSVPLYVVFNGTEEGTFREPDNLRVIEAIEAELRQVEGVSHAIGAPDLVRVANKVLHEGDPAEERIPDTRGAVAEAVFTIPKDQLRRLANSNHSKTNIVVRTGAFGSAAMRSLEQRIRNVLAKHPLPEGISVDVTGNAILINRSADGISGNQIMQVGFAALTILLLVALAFRSLRIALLSMVPNIVPVLVFFGALGAGAATLNIATAMIGSIALGIAIDDTVHYLVAYHRERERGQDPVEAALYCVHRVGRPITVTTIIIFAGFLSLLISNFVTLREFGYLTAMTMAICLTTDLLLLPALLVRLRA